MNTDRIFSVPVSARQELPYGWAALPSGLVFDRRMRRLYRAGLQAFEAGRAAEPPAPFESEADFMGWLNEPVAAGLRPRVSRYLYSIYQDRPDLQHAFPNLEGGDCARYFTWLRGDGIVQEKIPRALLPPRASGTVTASAASRLPPALRDGVNVAGYFKAELGIGEAARLLHEAPGLRANSVRTRLTTTSRESRRDHPFEPAERQPTRPYDVNMICVNADRTPDFAKRIGPGFFQGRYNIGYWFWELEQFPPACHRGFDIVDEVWVGHALRR